MKTTLVRGASLLFSLSAALTAASWQDATDGAAPLVYVAEVDSIIHPVSAEYMIGTMDRADRERRDARRVHAAHARRPRGFHARHRRRT